MMFSRKDLARLLVPLIIEQILAELVGMADVMMVAAVGETAVSGVSLVDSISSLMIQLLGALTAGGAVVCSQYMGRRQTREASRAAGQLILISTLFASVFTLIALVGNRHLLNLIFGRAEKAVIDNAMTYFWLTALSYPFLALYNSGAALFRSMGNSKVSMRVSMVMNVINVAGNAFCIFVLHMGVEGVALPTLLSRGFSAVVMMLLVRHPENDIRVSGLKQLIPEMSMIHNILIVGVPSGLETGIFQFGKISIQSLVSTLGTTSIAGFAVATNLVNLHYLPGRALGLGLITIAGQCVGAGEYVQAKKYTKKLAMINYALLFCICGAMLLALNPLIGLYQLSAESSRLAKQLIMIHSCGMMIWPLGFLLPHALRAGLDARFTMVVSIFSMWAFRIGFAYLFVKGMNMGVIGVWMGMMVDWLFRSVLFVWRFRGFTGRARQV